MAVIRKNRKTRSEQWAHEIRSNRTLKALFDWNFDLENRVRSLEGQPAVTRQQARQALRTRYMA